MSLKSTVEALSVRLRAAYLASHTYLAANLRAAVRRADVAVRVSYLHYVVLCLFVAIPVTTMVELWRAVRPVLVDLWEIFVTERQLGRKFWRESIAE